MKVISDNLMDYDKLPIDGESVILTPGYLKKNYGELSFEEMTDEIIRDCQKGTDELIEEINKVVNRTAVTYQITHNYFFDIIIKATGTSNRQLIKSKLLILKDDIDDYLEDPEDDDLPSVSFSKPSNPKSFRATVFNLCKQLGISASCNDLGSQFEVTYKNDKKRHAKSTSISVNMSYQIQQWLDLVTPMVPTEPPSDILSNCTDSYFRTVLNKSPYHVTYRRGSVTIYPAGIKDGVLYLGSLRLAPVDSISIIDLLLNPYGYNHTHVKGVNKL